MQFSKATKYWKRLVPAMTWPMILSGILVLVFLYNQNIVGIWIGVGFFFFLLVREAYWARYQVLGYEIDQGVVIFQYQKFNKVHSCKIPVDGFNIKWRGLPIKQKAYELKFYNRDNHIFSQMSFGVWSLEHLQSFLEELYHDIDKEPSLDTRMTLDWWGKD